MASLGHLLDRFDLELIRVPLATHTDLLDCQKLWLEDVYERLGGPDIRVMNGVSQIINNAQSAAIFSLSDSGNVTVPGSIKPSTTANVIAITAGDMANARNVGEVISSDLHWLAGVAAHERCR
ncbi:hypothetical protein, partial [Aquabacterium sp.]|uniref:hypothetical protein n=1 Tax=Aquabacterium sp. TaxID=1872578 RepID=UPI0035AFEBCD